ncbi:MAG: glycosyltransferase [Candidatus Latescibacterota bacterium]|nr:MAG: glycosyltransferase [Candidatus Latescibacterota bacterium]
MNSVSAKQVIALYLRYFLSPSETFVYRQLEGVSSVFDPIVLTSVVCNPDLYPVDRLYAMPKGLAGRVYTRLKSTVTGRFGAITPAQRSCWSSKLREHRARLVHAHFGHFGMDVLGITRSLDIPLVVTFHGMDASHLLNDSRYTRELAELFEYAHVITISRDMARRLSRYGARESRLDVHYIGVPVDTFDFVRRVPVADKIAREETVRCLQVSNFVEKKGHRYTVDAFARHLATHPKHRLVLAGDGPLRASVEARCREKGIEQSVDFTGRVVKSEVSDLMRDADVFLHHSVTAANGDMEGIPTVIMEAMSTGLVVISTVHSGIPELVDDGVDGYLVGERDLDAYVGALDRLGGSDPDLPKKARAKIETKFNMSVQNKKLVEIYQKVIDG